ncbi:hypothetical protein [Methylomonas rosea]|uniref:TubC N-terminal docking domain-containing protein n=1 Tax=Methylomonas rosea TaxID=2952227 RepID=A0ABT1TYH7_9GAMM|nr:hypothetical protein [Methylomonas sp. WSC-7]MCQ8119827.1 hypothetical protein [Methylomonas sp. WSC-7]
MSALHFITSLQSSGFAFSANGDSLVVNPASQLSSDERDYLRKHKAEILAFIGRNTTRPTNDEYPQSIEVWTPNGNKLLAEARSAKHAADLKRWNPPSRNHEV